MSQDDTSANISDKSAFSYYYSQVNIVFAAPEAPTTEDQPIIDFDKFALADPFTFDWPDDGLNLPFYN
jgi:hypothetical protein